MSKKEPWRDLPPPTTQEREVAAQAALTLKAVIADPSLRGERSVAHIDMSRPRRGIWIETWAGIPGFQRVNGKYQHDCLPGWEYAKNEIKPEMIPDLEALAERGVRPTEATS